MSTSAQTPSSSSNAVLNGKVAFIQGGSRGIGAAIARRLAADGAAVVLTYASSPDRAAEVVAAIEAKGGRALAIRADSADAGALQAAVAQAAAAFGRPSGMRPHEQNEEGESQKGKGSALSRNLIPV